MKAAAEKEAAGREAKLTSMAVPQLACLLDKGHNNERVPQLSPFSGLKYEVNQSHVGTQATQTGAHTHKYTHTDTHTEPHTSRGAGIDKRAGLRPSTMIIIAAAG